LAIYGRLLAFAPEGIRGNLPAEVTVNAGTVDIEVTGYVFRAPQRE